MLLLACEPPQITVLDVIPNRPSIVMLSRTGSVKRMGATHFAAQNRGGRGKSGAKLVDGDEVGEVRGGEEGMCNV